MSRFSRALALSGSGMALLLAVAPARAAGWPDDGDSVSPCRPTISCTAELSAPGTLELEVGYISRKAVAQPPQRSFPVLFKLTLATWLQVQVGSNGYTVQQGDAPVRFFDNVVLGLKFHLADQSGARPAFAITAAASLPTPAGQEGYVRAYDAFFTGHASKDVGRLHGDLNVGTYLWRIEDHPIPQVFGALALSTMAHPFGVMAETYVFSSAAPVATRDGGVLLAFTHMPRPWLIFDIGGDAGFFPATRKYSVFVGTSIVPARLWR